ncbi:MAG: cytochrome C oxidase subunit IV family protein [Planctomycetaceae bacterium]
MAYQETAEGHHEHHHVNYMAIFIALCVCTAISVVFDLVKLDRRLIAVLVLAVAVAKAQFVMRYFMHLKFEGAWKYVLLLPTAILACGLPLALAPDIGLHYYRPDVPQVRTAAQLEATGGHGEEATEHHDGEAH